MRSHGKTLRQLTTASTTINSLLTNLRETWISIVEERFEIEKMYSNAIASLAQYLAEEPPEKPSWWSEEDNSNMEGALLLLLMTGTSEPGVVKWISEKFISLVSVLKINVLIKANCKEMGKEDTRWA